MKFFIKFLFVTLWILTACTPTVISNVSQENMPAVNSTLKSQQDYIFYEIWKPGAVETWVVNPQTGDSFLIAKGDLQIGPWSPSGDYWLFNDDNSLYRARADGSHMQRVYQFQETDDCGRDAWWLSEDIIMMDIWGCDTRGRAWPPPQQYYINIETGEAGRLDPVNEYEHYGTYLIQGIVPHEESWIQWNYITGEVEIADLDGNHTQILNELDLRTDAVSWSVEFIPNTAEVIFEAWRKDATKPDDILIGLWKMSLSNKVPELILEQVPDTQIEEYHVSPDGRTLAYAYAKGPQFIVAFYDIQSKKINYEWDFPYHLSSPRFVWSPDSRYIALPYSKYDYGTPEATSDGIQIMDVSTGKTRLLIDQDVWMRYWH